MNISSPPRRWFRFGSLVLIVAVTVGAMLGAWVWRQVDWARQRQEILQSGKVFPVYRLGSLDADPPVGLWLFGERGVAMLVVHDDTATEKDLEQLRRLFPETDVQRSTRSDPAR